MKKFLAVFLSALMAVLCLASCGTKTISASEALADAEAAEGKKIVFTVGFDAEFPPYGYLDEKTNEYVGFDLDLAAEVCKRNEWNLYKQPIKWEAKDNELSAGSIDCIWNGFTINGREDSYTWTDAYVDNSQVFVTKKSSNINTFEDLKGKIVEVQADSSAYKALTAEEDNAENLALAKTFAKLTQVPDYNTAFLDLDAGSCDVIAMDIGVAQYQIKSRNSDEYIILDKVLAAEQYGVGFKLGNTALRDVVQKTINEMVADGTFSEIAEEWGLSDSVCLGK